MTEGRWKKLRGDIKKGNRAAFEEIFDELSAQVLRAASHYISSVHDAEQVVGIVFEDMIKNASRIPETDWETFAEGWLWTVSRNKSIDELRRGKNSRERDVHCDITLNRVQDELCTEKMMFLVAFLKCESPSEYFTEFVRRTFDGEDQNVICRDLGLRMNLHWQTVRTQMLRIQKDLTARFSLC